MSTLDITPEEGMNPQEEALTETVEETTETQAQEETEETVPKSQFAQVLARAKKAEEEARLLREKSKSSTTKQTLSKEDIEETILLAEGIDEETLGEMKILAKARGTTLLAVKSDPIYLAMKEVKEKEAKEKAARLGVSRGSPTFKPQKTVSSPGLTDEEHKALWKEQFNK